MGGGVCGFKSESTSPVNFQFFLCLGLRTMYLVTSSSLINRVDTHFIYQIRRLIIESLAQGMLEHDQPQVSQPFRAKQV
jgi:hypothetical protein